MRGTITICSMASMLACLPLARPAAASHLYVSPTAGVSHWDDDAYPDLEFDKGWAFLYGGRAGYAFTQAFSGEVVVLTGTNDAAFGTQVFPEVPPSSMRVTELSISLLVHFQSLTSAKIYPFLDLGAGTIFRSGGPGSLDDNHTAFHLGGGIMFVLDPRFAIRTNLRDTFFTDKRSGGNLTEQLTVDALELSLGVEFRIPTRQKGSRPE